VEEKRRLSLCLPLIIFDILVVVMEKLPGHVFYRIRDYLSYLQYVLLMNSSKRVFKDVKHETVYYSLGMDLSVRFLIDQKFQSLLLSRIKDKSKQLGLIFFEYHRNLLKLGKLKKLTMLNTKQLTNEVFSKSFQSIPFLRICNNPDLISLDNISPEILKLHLMNFDKLIDISNFNTLKACKLVRCNVLKDISPLSNLLKLILSDCPEITDISCLGRLQQLQLIDCPGLTHLKGLGNIPEIKIDRCTNILSIEELTNNKRVFLHRMDHLKDFSSLTDSQEIHLISDPQSQAPQSSFGQFHLFYECFSLKLSKFQVSPATELFPATKEGEMKSSRCFPPKVKKLILQECSFSPSLSSVQQEFDCLTFLELNDIKDLRGVSAFGHIKSLRIVNCQSLGSLNGLGPEGNSNVFLSGCSAVNDFSALNGIPKVTIESCSGFTDGNHVKNVTNLTITTCANISCISMLRDVYSLTIVSCGEVNSLIGLENVHELTILYCFGIYNILGIGNNYKIVFPLFSGLLNLDTGILKDCYTCEETQKYVIFLRRNNCPLK
jgi:hypothetical protein